MKFVHFSLLTLSLALSHAAWAQTEVRLAVSDSFDLPKPVIAQFEQQNDAKVSIVKLGSGNEMLKPIDFKQKITVSRCGIRAG